MGSLQDALLSYGLKVLIKLLTKDQIQEDGGVTATITGGLTAKDTALISVKNLPGSVTVMLGGRATGKSTLAYRFAQFLDRPTFAVSPQEVPPSWVRRIHLSQIEEMVGPRTTLICDDLPAYLSNRDYNEELSMVVERIIPMVRHERQPPEFPVGEVHLIFCSQTAAQADRYILDCDLAFLKPLGLLAYDIERPNIKRIYRSWVDPEFEQRDDVWIKRHAYMISRSWRGIVEINKS